MPDDKSKVVKVLASKALVVGTPIGAGATDGTLPDASVTPAAKVGDKNIAPETTAEQDTMTAGQRRVNLIWEITQASIAVIVAVATLWVAGNLAIQDKGNEAAFLLLSNVFFMVVSTYFARTNHTRTGGVKQGDTGR